jgi:hypothetical protein
VAAQYGEGFTYDNLTRKVKLAELFPDREIVGALSRELGWSHFLLLLPVKDALKREFYAEMSRVERWSVRTLRDKMGGMLYERTALSKKTAELAKRELASLRSTDQLSPDLVFRDPYFLNFLGLKDTYGEKDLEAATLRRDRGIAPRTRRRVHVRRAPKANGDRRRGVTVAVHGLVPFASGLVGVTGRGSPLGPRTATPGS